LRFPVRDWCRWGPTPMCFTNRADQSSAAIPKAGNTRPLQSARVAAAVLGYSYQGLKYASQPIPKQYRDELGLGAGVPVAVLRVGEAFILVPEQDRFRTLCESITSVFERRQVSPTDLLDMLPVARRRVLARRYPELAGNPGLHVTSFRPTCTTRC